MRVLRTVEYRRRSLWKSALAAVLGELGVQDLWHVLTLNDSTGNPVARWRFAKEGEAERARERFVEVVGNMSSEGRADTDWQSVLDRVQEQGGRSELPLGSGAATSSRGIIGFDALPTVAPRHDDPHTTLRQNDVDSVAATRHRTAPRGATVPTIGGSPTA
jgi:hypothetical protein